MERVNANLPVPFYLAGQAGDLFAIYHPPHLDPEVESPHLIYLHPFAEEATHSRNFISSFACGLARCGVGVLLLDLFGCGDSSGEFRDCRWQSWKNDVTAAVAWLNSLGHRRISVSGLRLGAMLAMDVSRSTNTFESIFLIQPAISGQSVMDQFLRLGAASAALNPMMGQSRGRNVLAEPKTNGDRTANDTMKARLLSGESINVLGFELSAELYGEIASLTLAPLGRKDARVHWIEITPSVNEKMPPGKSSVIDGWRTEGLRVSVHRIVAEPFWLASSKDESSGEILQSLLNAFKVGV